MGSISLTDARALSTKTLQDVFIERPRPTRFFRSFFPDKVSMTKELSIEVQRGTEKVATDVVRGSIGDRVQVSRSTEKVYVPPYYRKYFDATELSLYDRVIGSTSIDSGIFSAFLEQIAEKQAMVVDTIERAYELQCAQVLHTGIVTLNNGESIDYKRKAASNIDLGAGNYWTTGTVDPFATLETAATFLRTEGKTTAATFDVIMGGAAYNAFKRNDIAKSDYDVKRYFLGDLHTPQAAAEGTVIHGMASGGAYNFRIWGYPQYYDDSLDVSTSYMDNDKIIVLPENPRFHMGFGAVPQLVTLGGGVQSGAYIFSEYVDERAAAHDFDVKSAGLAIPVGVDQMYTAKVIA